MAGKISRSGGKYGGNHSSLIPAAALVCKVLERSAMVSTISPGFIKAGLPSVKGNRRVKIVSERGSLRLVVRDNTSQQELHIYTTDPVLCIDALARALTKENIQMDSTTMESAG